MKSRKYQPVASLFFSIMLLMLICSSILKADSQSAWEALHRLDIPEARRLFEKALHDNPQDPALMRGMMITAYLDMDQEKYFEMIDNMTKADPSDPYLLAVFEHLFAEMSDWGRQFDYYLVLGKALSENSAGAASYLGRKMLESYYHSTLEKCPEDFAKSLGYAPGAWIIGPFNNESNIAAYRSLPLEHVPLDTLTITKGRQGSKVGWTWLGSDKLGNFFPSIAMESGEDYAVQMRLFFELTSPKKIRILLGGAHSCRMLVDGEKVHEDPVFRNAVQRFGIEADLSGGTHEITLILGTEYLGLAPSLAILDDNYHALDNLKWLRYTDQISGNMQSYREFHPIFDTYNENMEKNPEPDALYFKTIIQIYNGYAKEAVQELEDIQAQKGLTNLETLALIDALTVNSEETLALEYLNQLHQEVSTPLTDMNWVSNTIDDYEALLNAFEKLSQTYPGRPAIEVTAAFKPLLNNDTKTLFENLEQLKHKYPDMVTIHTLLYSMYLDVVEDPESAYDEFGKYCEKSKARLTYLSNASDYFILMGKYDEAVKKAYEAYEYNPFMEAYLSQLAHACKLARREKELIPFFEELRQKYPYNIENQARLFSIYENTGMYDNAQDMVEDIHSIKPSAVMPHLRLASLHNGVDYDSIFGSIDAMDLWKNEPTEEEKGNENMWSLIDRLQMIVFESGLVFKDYHWALVLTDKAAVEDAQEIDLEFDPNEGFNNLLVARRLRKGQPPLSGEISGSYVLFKDLKPGDAIELRYRIWSQNSGDLWQHFWSKFTINGSYFQRYIEYTILTNRDDLAYYADSIAGEPTTQDQYCSFKRISWKHENLPAQSLDLSALPPEDDIVGKILVSTLPDWGVLNQWYRSISEAVLDNNPRTEKLAKELTAGKNTDFDKMLALYKHVVMDIPYQLIGFDYHVAIPQKPDQVLINGWGDCKDKSHLLIKMLRTCGIDAWPVLVMTRTQGTWLPIPYFGFNHLITGAVIDGDTLFIDPADTPYPPDHSLDWSLCGQPCLNIPANSTSDLGVLPKFVNSEKIVDQDIVLKYVDSSQFDISYSVHHYNLQSGYRRSIFRQLTAGELKSYTESGVSDRWGIRFMLDSLDYDSVSTIDTVFSERWQGRAFLNIQSVSNVNIIKVPNFSIFEKGFVAQLTENGVRTFPVDLRDYAGRYNIDVTIETPESYGTPEIGDDIMLEDSLYRFEQSSEWNPDERKLVLHYAVEIQDGLAEPEGFINFAHKITEIFDKLIMFKSN